MLFNSLEFLGFFVVVTGLYFALRWGWRWKMLLVASCFFYMSFVPVYIVILFSTIVVDYWMALLIEPAAGRRRRLYLVISVVATCLILFAFKYYDFFVGTVNGLAGAAGRGPLLHLAHIILPIGLSFHTFQSLSYVIEVYRGRQKAERNFGLYSLYVMYYPQLVAGPIERPQNLLGQFRADHRFKVDDVLAGLRIMAWGFFKKMVVADRAAVYVNAVYGDWRTQPGLPLLVATVLFAVQIYADFSGYSSIAIGCSRLMGIRLMENFRTPYFAGTLADFWRRWHISLSTWFRDYVYIPLGGNRASPARRHFNLAVTFVISGVWHGANWTFVAWGAYHGVLLVLENLAHSAGLAWRGWGRPVGWLVTLGLVMFGWVFFRAESLGAAVEIIRKITTGVSLSPGSVQQAVLVMTGDNTAPVHVLTVLFFTGLMFLIEFAAAHNVFNWVARVENSRRWQAAGAAAALQGIIFFGVLRPSAFIYFQF